MRELFIELTERMLLGLPSTEEINDEANLTTHQSNFK
jgi:hypothetical protein